MKTALLLLLSATVAWSYPNHVPNGYPFNTAAENQRSPDSYLQELYPRNIPDDAAAVASTHPQGEVMAQSICTSIAGGQGWIYAVQRSCGGAGTCTQICTSAKLRSQDPQTQGRQWFAVAAIHVYANRPCSTPGTPANPHIGLKVFRYGDINAAGCGPNWCCCSVPA
ncbi:hypothetical protein GBAR_LOCUS18230 [Geodia barretti]|uniref:Uncharacterized protein n=1 Tax=Geodia barretti TaxID=519541 RepID=A0AA35SN95_GEOBA|nr:hypothetical protein GBAR_LOCUS18230 [Geodia barretti]